MINQIAPPVQSSKASSNNVNNKFYFKIPEKFQAKSGTELTEYVPQTQYTQYSGEKDLSENQSRCMPNVSTKS